MQLPLWLDSFGTVLAAYVLGPVCGAIVGLTNNIIYGFQDPIAYLYGLTSIAIGIATGLFAKRKYFEDVFHTLSASVVVTLISVVISSALNICFYNGNTGNLWGDVRSCICRKGIFRRLLLILPVSFMLIFWINVSH